MISIQGRLAFSPGTDREAEDCYAELVHAAKAGSHAAFGELQKIHSHRLYKRIVSITRSHEDAEDALQDTFLRAFLALPSFEGRSKFSTWLTRIAINSALMTIRKHRNRPEITTIDSRRGIEDDIAAFDVCDNDLDPEQFCDQKQRCYARMRAIQRLEPKLRVPMHILVSQEHSMKELAEHLRISVASVKARLHRARKRLRDRIEFQPRNSVTSTSHFRPAE
jgi:RNA polymerase sigma-70 factor (ECF subfamily)